jgi:DNA-binding phage protein
MARAQRFDAAPYLTGWRFIALYLTEAFKTGDVRLIVKAIGTVVRAIVAQIKSPG